MEKITDEIIEKTYQKLKNDAEKSGYFLNPNLEFTKGLIEGLLINEKRYGYQSCPCRLAEGIKEKDLDIICPCDYRDDDINDYGTCYCGLYVSKAIYNKEKMLTPIPDRRGTNPKSNSENSSQITFNSIPYPIWRCKVCGYLCARDFPPELCPICKASKERFEKFL